MWSKKMGEKEEGEENLQDESCALRLKNKSLEEGDPQGWKTRKQIWCVWLYYKEFYISD